MTKPNKPRFPIMLIAIGLSCLVVGFYVSEIGLFGAGAIGLFAAMCLVEEWKDSQK